MKKYPGIELMETVPVGTAIIRLAMPMVSAMPASDILTTGIAVILGRPLFRLMRGE
jgi:hypothetical protein